MNLSLTNLLVERSRSLTPDPLIFSFKELEKIFSQKMKMYVTGYAIKVADTSIALRL